MGRFNHWTWLMTIRDRLIELRRERNLTQQEMANAIGVHVNQIRRYEAGATQPSLDVLKNIALNLNITIDSLVFVMVSATRRMTCDCNLRRFRECLKMKRKLLRLCSKV